MTEQIATIDNKTVSVRRGETILEAARRAGLDIPTLCYHRELSPEGGCRICLVETDRGQIHAACHTPLQPGMEISTSSPRIGSLRRDILSLYLSAHPADAFRPSSTGTEIEQLMHRLGVSSPRSATRAKLCLAMRAILTFGSFRHSALIAAAAYMPARKFRDSSSTVLKVVALQRTSSLVLPRVLRTAPASPAALAWTTVLLARLRTPTASTHLHRMLLCNPRVATAVLAAALISRSPTIVSREFAERPTPR